MAGMVVQKVGSAFDHGYLVYVGISGYRLCGVPQVFYMPKWVLIHIDRYFG